jgi:hypothetical protein
MTILVGPATHSTSPISFHKLHHSLYHRIEIFSSVFPTETPYFRYPKRPIGVGHVQSQSQSCSQLFARVARLRLGMSVSGSYQISVRRGVYKDTVLTFILAPKVEQLRKSSSGWLASMGRMISAIGEYKLGNRRFLSSILGYNHVIRLRSRSAESEPSKLSRQRQRQLPN